LTRWNRRYLVEYGAALAFYLLAVSICIPHARAATHPATRILLLVAPCVGIGVMAMSVVRHVLRIDEYMRRTVVEYFAVAAAATGIWTLAYGFFELAGFPRLSMWWIWPGMSFAMLVWFGVKRFMRQ
jgi:hypothetical protein